MGPRYVWIVSIIWCLNSPLAEAVHGLAMHGKTKYAPGMNLEYVNPKAPKGGKIIIGWEGDFDNLNPFAVKGLPPLLLSRLVFESLGHETLDEPFSMYGSLAKDIKLADDKMSMVLTLDPAAKFSDGKPVTPDDVVFSYKLFMSEKVRPFYSSYWADIKTVTAQKGGKVNFVYRKKNPELPLITLQMPILPKHVYDRGNFAKDFAEKAVASGPYVVEKFKRGSSVTYKRNPAYWGKDLDHNRGRFNFDEVMVKYYKDTTALVEGFKKGEFDLYYVNHSKVWATDLSGDRFTKNWIKKELWNHENNQGGQGFIFNLRKKIFQDARVRKAIALAFDFSWSNKNLFYGQYKESQSFFENSPLKATGMPNEAELKVLNAFKAEIPLEVFTQPVGYLGKGQDIRQRLRSAKKLLAEAGYKVTNGVATGPAGELKFEIILGGPSFQRIIEPFLRNLKRIGVVAKTAIKEPAVYVKHVDGRMFDMVVRAIGQSQSPGNEQRDFWSSRAAEDNFTRNYASIKNKAVDEIIEKVIYAKNRDELELYTRCLDRVLYHLHFVVHNWHITNHRVSFWNKFGMPKKKPRFYSPIQFMSAMWVDQDLERKLNKAKASGAALF